MRRREGLTIHYSPHPIGRPGTPTTPVETVIECARTLPFIDALAVADSALRSRTVSRDALVAAAECSPRTGRTKALRVVNCADHRAANPFESGLRAIALGVPGFEAQAQCPVGNAEHVDVGDQHLRIALEAESFEFHALPEAFTYDIRRYTGMVRNGWLVGRFTWDDVMHRPVYVATVTGDRVALRARS